MARPKKIDVTKLILAAYDYAEHTEIPIVAEFAHLQHVSRSRLYDLASNNAELSDAIKYITECKEIALEKGGLGGKYSQTMAIFSLKQLGWKDRVEHTEDIKHLKAVKEILDGVDSAID